MCLFGILWQRLSAVTQLGIETLANISVRICQRAQEISDKMENALMMIIKVLCGGVLGGTASVFLLLLAVHAACGRKFHFPYPTSNK